MNGGSLLAQIMSVAAALLLLSAFALLAQRHMRALMHWFALQGVVLALASALVAALADVPELYFSAVLTLALKGMFLPWLLWRLVVRLGVHREVEPLWNITATLLVGAALVWFAFQVALPVERLTHAATRNTIAIALACLFLGLLMMVTRRKAVTQVVGLLAMENALFFTAVAATYGMPLVVELGVAFDVLVATVVIGLFFFHMRDTFDSLDVAALERRMREGEE